MRGRCTGYAYADMREDALDVARRWSLPGSARTTAWRWWRKPGRIRRAVLRVRLCRRLARAAAPADRVRRQGKLYRSACGAVRQQRSQDPSLPGEIGEMAAAAAERQGCEGQSWEDFALRPDPMRPARSAARTISATCNIPRLDPLPTGVAVTHGRCCTICGPCQAMDLRGTTAWSAGCRGITTWASSAASCR